jgi:Domain of unknown function (DUF4169)
LSEIVNLRLVRKRKARAEADQVAAERRSRFGRSKAETQAQTLRDDLSRRALDGHRRTPENES